MFLSLDFFDNNTSMMKSFALFLDQICKGTGNPILSFLFMISGGIISFIVFFRRYFRLIDRMGSTAEFFEPDFLNDCRHEAIFKKFSVNFNNPGTKSYFNKMTHFDMLGSLPGLLQVEDRVSMSVSIESRVPLLDRRIVDLISRMPAGMKFKGGEMKYLLKKNNKRYYAAGNHEEKR